MKTAGFLAFVFFGFFGSMIFIYYMWKPFLMSDPQGAIIAGDIVVPSIVPIQAVNVSPTVFYGPDGIVYHRY